MPFLVIVADDTINQRWQIISNNYNTSPCGQSAILYTSLSYYNYVPIKRQCCTISIQNATTGASGSGRVVEI